MQTKKIGDEIRKNPDAIPSLPDVVAKAMQLLDDPNAGPGDFEALLSRDPPLVATMLRMANSPVYGFAHKKETVRDAIIGMGLNGLRGVLMGSTLKHFLGSKFSCYGKDPETLWRHAMAVGAGARFLAKELPAATDDPEEMFVAGLLHDLGKLLLAPYLTRLGEDLSQATEPAHEVEQRVLGMDHQEAGDVVAEKWNLTPMVRAVIARHHHRTCPKPCRSAVAVIRLVDQVASEHDHGAGLVTRDPDVFEEDLATLDLQPDQWEALRASVVDAIDAALAAS